MIIRPVSRVRTAFVLLWSLMASSSCAISAKAMRETAYIGNYAGQSIYRLDISYHCTRSLSTYAMRPVARGIHVDCGLAFIQKHRLAVGDGILQLVNPNIGTRTTVNTNNGANYVVVDANGQIAPAGTRDTPLSSVPLAPLVDGMAHLASGDNSRVTAIPFTPMNGVFYATGARGHKGNVGTINLSTFNTRRLLSNLPAVGIHYDPFSHTAPSSASPPRASSTLRRPTRCSALATTQITTDIFRSCPTARVAILPCRLTDRSAGWRSSTIPQPVWSQIRHRFASPTCCPQLAFASVVAVDISMFAHDFEP